MLVSVTLKSLSVEFWFKARNVSLNMLNRVWIYYSATRYCIETSSNFKEPPSWDENFSSYHSFYIEGIRFTATMSNGCGKMSILQLTFLVLLTPFTLSPRIAVFTLVSYFGAFSLSTRDMFPFNALCLKYHSWFCFLQWSRLAISLKPFFSCFVFWITSETSISKSFCCW